VPGLSEEYELSTGITYTSYYDIFTIGAGELNIQACDAIRPLPPALPAASPVASYNDTRVW
jgi:hypothetical protein